MRLLRALHLNRFAARAYYRYFHGFASAVEELPDVIQRCMRRARATGLAECGDYYEFGVFKGHTFYHAYRAATDLGLEDMRFFGFDSFRGLPPPRGLDATKEEHFYEGQYAWPLERVRKELTKHGVDWSRCRLIEGYFDQTLVPEAKAEHQMAKASVVLIDSDLYESAATVLAFLEDMLLNNSILIMDDWNAFDRDDTRGERRALAEFLAAHRQWRAVPWFYYGAYGQVFIMRRNNRWQRRAARDGGAPSATRES